MDGRVCRIPCLLFCRWVVWRSREPSWWPIASLVSLMCTHRWARPTQWTNVAHRVVLRKGSSRLLFFPHAHSPFSHPESFSFFHVSPAGSAFSSLFFRLVTSLLTSSGSILLHVTLRSFLFLFPRRASLAYVFFRLIVAYCCPMCPPSLFPSCMTSAPPFVLVDVSTFSAFKSMGF